MLLLLLLLLAARIHGLASRLDAGQARSDALPVVMTSDGAVRGWELGGVVRFLGLPFAAPPVGERRWQQPAPVVPWAPAVREALYFAPDCLAKRSANYIKFQGMSEDCLYLNVFVANGTAEAGPAAGRPVMVFLYGGSWEAGGSSFPIYDGGSLALRHQVVVVTANYRLGPFGYLGAPQLAANDPRGSTGNYGSQDQRQALRWVQRNIAAFGGDPQQVMLFGESAGGGSVVNHLVMPASNGLFQIAAMESGPPSDWSAMSLSTATLEFDRLVAGVNCSSAPDVVACLRTVSGPAILANEHGNGSLLLEWSPVIDHVELIDQPQRLWERNQTNNVRAILLGSNTDEGTDFTDQAKSVPNASAYVQYVHERYPGVLGQQLLQLYPFEKFSRGGFATSMIFGDSLMACPARRGARWMARRRIPAFLYHFEHAPALLKRFDPTVGVAHGAEVPFVFGFDALLLSATDRYVSQAMMSYWTALAANATPAGAGDLPRWPAFDVANNALLRINGTITTDVNYKLAECDLWDRVYEAGCQVLSCPCPCDNMAVVPLQS